MNGVERFAQNLGKDLGILFSSHHRISERGTKTDRAIAVALRIFGMVGVGASVGVVAFAIATSGPVGIVAALALGALGFALSRDLMVIGDNMSKQLNAFTEISNPGLRNAVRQVLNEVEVGLGVIDENDHLIKDTWIIKPVSKFIDSLTRNQSEARSD